MTYPWWRSVARSSAPPLIRKSSVSSADRRPWLPGLLARRNMRRVDTATFPFRPSRFDAGHGVVGCGVRDDAIGRREDLAARMQTLFAVKKTQMSPARGGGGGGGEGGVVWGGGGVGWCRERGGGGGG